MARQRPPQPRIANRRNRPIKTRQLHVGDTGVVCALLGLEGHALAVGRTLLGPLPETFAFQEPRGQATWQEQEIALLHFRDKDGAEVDIVVERGARDVAAIEVKAAPSVCACLITGS